MEQKIDEAYKKVLKTKYIMIILIFLCFSLFTPIIILKIMFYIQTNGLHIPYDPFLIPTFYSILIFLIILIGSSFIISIYVNKWYRNYYVVLEDKEIKIKSGLILKMRIFLPYEKIQNLKLGSGFFERRFGFSFISISTTGYSFIYSNMNNRTDIKGPGISIKFPYQFKIHGFRNPKTIMDEIYTKIDFSKRNDI